jgi:hypothetical protein
VIDPIVLLRRRGIFVSQSVSKVQGATFFRNLRGLACFPLAVRTKLTNAVEELKMYNDISLRRGEEIWAPPERPNYAAPPNRNFSDVSCKVHILEIELYQ